MKKFSTLFITAFSIFWMCNSNAAVVTVTAQDFSFSPSNITINLGDQVMWMWGAGNHTSTSTTIPAGAASWDAPINQNSQMFVYTPTVAGSYDYICVFHQSMGMTGHITVNTPTGISENVSPVLILKNNTVASNGLLEVGYDIPVSAAAQLQLYDILGKSVYTFFSARKPAGTYTETYSVAGLRRGIYFLQLEAAAARVTRRIIVD